MQIEQAKASPLTEQKQVQSPCATTQPSVLVQLTLVLDRL